MIPTGEECKRLPTNDGAAVIAAAKGKQELLRNPGGVKSAAGCSEVDVHLFLGPGTQIWVSNIFMGEGP